MRKPLVHFVALGALLFAVQPAWQPAPLSPERATIVVPELPDAAAMDAAIDDEVLFREALALEFDRHDKVVRARLISVGRFLGLGKNGSDDAVEREARALDLQRSDPVVRRHLVEMMRLAAAKPEKDEMPTESALITYYEQHAARFVQPARIRFTHVYLSAERRGARLERDAAEVRAVLRQQDAAPDGAPALGDPFVRGADLTMSAPAQLEEVFGPGFAAAVAALPERTWSEPVRSAYGLHVVWIAARTPAAPPPFSTIRNRVLHEMLSERSAARVRETLQALRARFDVRIDAEL